MTDPRGPCFVSYRRTRAADAGLLVQMLRERGIPTWKDVADLATTPTEAELRQAVEGLAKDIRFFNLTHYWLLSYRKA